MYRTNADVKSYEAVDEFNVETAREITKEALKNLLSIENKKAAKRFNNEVMGRIAEAVALGETKITISDMKYSKAEQELWETKLQELGYKVLFQYRNSFEVSWG